jgi:hypothetical protein
MSLYMIADLKFLLESLKEWFAGLIDDTGKAARIGT